LTRMRRDDNGAAVDESHEGVATQCPAREILCLESSIGDEVDGPGWPCAAQGQRQRQNTHYWPPHHSPSLSQRLLRIRRLPLHTSIHHEVSSFLHQPCARSRHHISSIQQ